MRALLASGLVLGVGAGATLAAWTDSEHSQATFTAGRFGIQGGVTNPANGVMTWGEHASKTGAASITFSLPAQAMAPGDTTYGVFGVRTTQNSMAGTVILEAWAENSNGLGNYLRYEVRTVPTPAQCNATNFSSGTQVIPANSTLITSAGNSQTLQANQASPVHYCFKVSMLSNTPTSMQGQTLTARWEFIAQSS